MSTIPDIAKAAKELMTKAVDNTKKELAGLRTSKASTTLLDVVRVEAYGNTVPLNQVAMIAAPEPRLLTVQPFDKGLTVLIEKAIRAADLGVNPTSQGNLIRVPIPPLSEERRKELVKISHKLAEEGRIAVRHARTDALGKIKKLEKISDDDKTRGEKDVQKIHDEAIKEIEKLVAAKEADLLTV